MCNCNHDTKLTRETGWGVPIRRGAASAVAVMALLLALIAAVPNAGAVPAFARQTGQN